MCFKFLCSCFGGKNDYGVTNRDPSYHHPLSTTSSGNSLQGDSTPPADETAAGGKGQAAVATATYQLQKPFYASSYAPPADESVKPLAAAGWNNNKVAHHTCRK